MGEIRLTPQQQQRLVVLNAVERDEMTIAEAIRLLGLSDRQLRRLRQEYRARGAPALVHGNRGRPSPRRRADRIRHRIVRLATTRYARVNHMHLQELLAQREHLAIPYTSLRRILHAAGIRSPRTRRAPKHHTRRERMPHEGMLVQFDGSHHAWLENRGPALVLHAAVDDATGKVLAAWFDTEETAAGYLHVFRQIALGPGLPLAAYTDRHGIFKRSPQEPWTLAEQLRGQRAPTQVGRVLAALGIQWVPASSPQAKGRIERLFGAWQDRLVTELRLARIHTLDAANAFLPKFLRRYNARFAKPPVHPDAVYRPWPLDLDPNAVFCFKYLRTVANDHTVSLGPLLLQILPNGRSYAKAKVEVHQRLDGTLAIRLRDQALAFRVLSTSSRGRRRIQAYARRHPTLARTTNGHLPQRGSRIPDRPRETSPPTSQRLTSTSHQEKLTQPWKPGPDHPWRKDAARDMKRKTLRQMGVTFSLVR